MYLELTLIFIFLIFSSLFSASETAITAASRAKIHKLKISGNKLARRVSDLRDNKEKFIGAILLGNNAFNIAASALATSIAIKAFGEEGVIYATLAMTVVVLIFAELLPKTFAFDHAESVALFVSPLISFFVVILGPFITFFNFIVKILRMLANFITPKTELVTPADELRGAIDFHHMHGGVVKSDKDMLGSILDLSDTTVSEIMVHRKNMITFEISTSPEKIIDFMAKEAKHTRIPLWEDNPDNIVGILHMRDLFKELQTVKSAKKVKLKNVMSKPWFIPETTPLKIQLNQFRNKRKHFAIVIDEYGSLQGLVTLEDILEEIVGQIEDEHDSISMSFIKIDKHSYLVKGHETIRDINRALNLNLPDEEASTIAGLIIHEAKKIPVEKETFTFYNLKFEIKECQDNYIDLIKITLPVKET